jgi:hypothetical protein
VRVLRVARVRGSAASCASGSGAFFNSLNCTVGALFHLSTHFPIQIK